MRLISISFELGESREYGAFFRRLHGLGGFPTMNSQWMLRTALTIHQIEGDLGKYIDPADRLLVTYVGAMSSRNLLNKFGTS